MVTNFKTLPKKLLAVAQKTVLGIRKRKKNNDKAFYVKRKRRKNGSCKAFCVTRKRNNNKENSIRKKVLVLRNFTESLKINY